LANTAACALPAAGTLGNANFGQITSATDPRTLQFGLRLGF
jgi:hypothetical protein